MVLPRDHAEHRADDNRAAETERDLGVAADEADAERGAGVRNLGEEVFREPGRRAFREEDRGEEPLRLRAGARVLRSPHEN